MTAWLPPAYLAYLLWTQMRADWPALSEPRLDLDTFLAMTASGYLVMLMATYWRKPSFTSQRRDLASMFVTLIAMDAFGFIARQPITQADAWAPAGVLVLLGTILAGWSARSLGRSFSLLPQARNVVSSGPYVYLRHPMYAGGVLITLGELWLRWAPISIAICGLALIAQLVRMGMEERLLEREFPDYRPYRARTSALIPGVY